MNGQPRKQVLEQLDALSREIAEYHRWLAEFPVVCRVLENLMLRVEHPLPGAEQARYRSISHLRDELRAMATSGAALPAEATPDAELLDWLDANNGAWMSDEKCLWHGEWPKRRAVHAATLREAIRAASLATPE